MDKGAAGEFGGAKLGDARLTKRLIKVAIDFADRPTANIPGACSGWDEAQRGTCIPPTSRAWIGSRWESWIWAREFKDADGKRPGVIESTRWIEGYERVAEAAEAGRLVRQKLFACRSEFSNGQGGLFPRDLRDCPGNRGT